MRQETIANLLVDHDPWMINKRRVANKLKMVYPLEQQEWHNTNCSILAVNIEDQIEKEKMENNEMKNILK